MNAVIRARGTKLLGRGELRSLAFGTMEKLEIFLLGSMYSERYREQLALSTLSPLRRVENALSAGISDQLKGMAALARGEAILYLDLFLSGGDLYNGRIALRSIWSGSRSSSPPLWHRYALLDAAFYDDLWLRCPKAADAAVRCHEEDHGLASILGEAFRQLHGSNDLASAERRLFTGWLDYWGRRLSPFHDCNAGRMKEFLGRIADTWNFSIWLRCFMGGEEECLPEKTFISGGWGLSREKLASSKSTSALFSDSPWEGLFREEGERKPAENQRAFHLSFLEWQRDLYRKNLLGIDVAIGFGARVLSEWQDLSMLSAGLSIGIPPEDMERHLRPED